MTDRDHLKQLRVPTKADPLRVLMSACLTGLSCGYDGTSYGDYPAALKLLSYETLKVTTFCPEEFSFGTPRELCDIHGGTGSDVLAGRARVLTASGADWTEGMIKASLKMLEIAKSRDIELAVMMDISAACGSQVIYEGNRLGDDKTYQVGMGVCAAQLVAHGFKVVSQRDFASLEVLYTKADPGHVADSSAKDHHETDWYQTYFKG